MSDEMDDKTGPKTPSKQDEPPPKIISPFDKHFEERSADRLFDFSLKRPEHRPATMSEAVPWTSTPLKRIHNVLAMALVLIVALAPVPLGSNRPVFWMIGAAFVFAVLGIYLALVAKRGFALRKPLWYLPVVSGSAILFVSYAVVQTLPIADLLDLGGLGAGSSNSGDTISLSRDATRLAALRWGSYGAFFFLMQQVSDNRVRARRMAWAIFMVVTAHAAYGLISFRFLGEEFFWGKKEAYLGVVTGTFINRNSFATFAGFGAVLGFSLLLHDFLRLAPKTRRLSWALSFEGIRAATLWICLIVILAALIATGSRMGLAATMAALFLVYSLSVHKHVHRSKGGARLLPTAQIVVLVAVLIIFGQTVLDRVIFSAQDGSTRFELYAQVVEIIRNRPIFGHGLDAFELAFEAVHRPPVSPDLVWGRAHSTYLTLWSEMGFLFGSLPLLICFALGLRMVMGFRILKRDYVLNIAGLGVLVLAALHSLVDFSLEMSANVFLFLALLALATSPRATQSSASHTSDTRN